MTFESRDDPFAIFGLTPAATLDEVRRARRQLAFNAHPDRGGSEVAMQQLNAAFDAAVAHLTGRRPLPLDGASPSDIPPRRAPARRPRTLEYHEPSFMIYAGVDVAWRWLLEAAGAIGEVLAADPPAQLEVRLGAPSPCWCRLTLTNEGGATAVGMAVGASALMSESLAPSVRDLWVRQLNIGP